MKLGKGGVIAAALMLIAASIACEAVAPGEPETLPQAATLEPAAAPANTAEPTLPPEPTATSDPCIPWD